MSINKIIHIKTALYYLTSNCTAENEVGQKTFNHSVNILVNFGMYIKHAIIQFLLDYRNHLTQQDIGPAKFQFGRNLKQG